jgi:hypothetical protein
LRSLNVTSRITVQLALTLHFNCEGTFTLLFWILPTCQLCYLGKTLDLPNGSLLYTVKRCRWRYCRRYQHYCRYRSSLLVFWMYQLRRSAWDFHDDIFHMDSDSRCFYIEKSDIIKNIEFPT